MLHVSTFSLLFFRCLPCLILYLPSGCTFSLHSTLRRKMKQTGSSENVGFNYWSKGLFSFLFDLCSLPYSSLNNTSLPVGNGTLVDVARWVGRKFSPPLLHIISLDWMTVGWMHAVDFVAAWLTAWFFNLFIHWLAKLMCYGLTDWLVDWLFYWLTGSLNGWLYD
jgi:hypothetical protein